MDVLQRSKQLLLTAPDREYKILALPLLLHIPMLLDNAYPVKEKHDLVF